MIQILLLILKIIGITLLAVIGFVTILNTLIYDNVHTREINVYTLNNENDIEYVLRSLKNSFPKSKITVTDLGSEDATQEIVSKLG